MDTHSEPQTPSETRARTSTGRVLVYSLLALAVLTIGGWKLFDHFKFDLRRTTYGPYADLFPVFESTSWSRDNPEEIGQTVPEFKRAWALRPNERLTTIYVQPLGDFDEAEREALETAEELLEVVFQMPVKELPPLGLDVVPESARRRFHQSDNFQLHTKYILHKVLYPKRPKDAAAYIAFTTTDLWPGEGFNFVFGEASLSTRMGVWSLARFGDPTQNDESRKQFIHRTLKLAVHETGHIFAMPHCITFRCGMNGTNGLYDTDEAPLAFCPECSEKILWATGTDPKVWYEALHEFARTHNLPNSAERWKRAAEIAEGEK